MTQGAKSQRIRQGHLAALILVAGAVIAGAVFGFVVARGTQPSDHDLAAERKSARASAYTVGLDRAFEAAKARGRRAGRISGTRAGLTRGTQDGEDDGREAVHATEAEIEAERLAELTYDPQLPNGDPGYILPEEERSIACIGISAVTGQCVGD